MLKLKITWKYCLAFYLVIMLYVSLHELVHHFVGYLVCGDWGYKTFNYFKTACAPDDNTRLIATYAGPVFTYVMMYVGAAFLKAENTAFKKHLGFAIIFAQLPLQRIIMPLFGYNDELYATSLLLGQSTELRWIVFLVLLLICLYPLIRAYKAIDNKRPWLWFAWYFVLFPYLIWGPIFGFLEYLMVERGVLNNTWIGIGWLFIINEIVTIGLYLKYKRHINPFFTRLTR